MVRIKILFIIIALCLAAVARADVKVSAEADETKIYENMPIKVLVTVSHQPQEVIDQSSFKVGGKKTEAKLVNEEQMTASGNLQLSMFNIELPPMSKGIQLVPEVEVRVNGKAYKSVPSTFMVFGGTQSDTSRPSSSQTKTNSVDKNITPKLTFEAYVDGPTKLYPGQKTLVGYRYSYNINVETTSEQTPLLEAKGLIKVGDKIAQEDQKDGSSTLQLIQIVKGDKPGEFTYGPSTLEGVPYIINSDGSRAYADQKISSTTAPITIKVVPFPEDNKPPSFNGALGEFKWQMRLLSSPDVSVGDELSLSVEATGKGDWDSVSLPELCCQPGMSGLFRLSDLPSVGKVEGQKKTFEVKLRPLSTSVTEIPSLEFSSLNPDTGKYSVEHSSPIPIQVKPGAVPPETPPVQNTAKEGAKGQWREQLKEVTPLEISGNEPLKSADLHNLIFGTWWVLLIIPLGIGLLMFQYNWQKFLSTHQAEQESKQSESSALFEQALKEAPGSSAQFNLLQRALLSRLVEKGELNSADVNYNKLASTGLQGDVRNLLHEIDENRYAGRAETTDDELLRRAKSLIEEEEHGRE